MFNNLYKKQRGNLGEDLAVKFLRQRGYKILARNYFIRGGELDIVAQNQQQISFVEVKTRYSEKFGSALESLTYFKLKALLRSAEIFLHQHRLDNMPYQIDLITIDYKEGEPIIEHHTNITY